MNRKPPADIARSLRQEAGFGCCVCGHPIFQYHHIVPWAADQHFRVEDMMVLCPNHHGMATQGALPEPKQREFKGNPKNIREGRVRGNLAMQQTYCAVKIGTIILVNEGPFLRINGEDLLSCHLVEGQLEISLKLYSERGDLLLEIARNEWVSGDPMPWDFEGGYRLLTLRQRAGKISLNLDVRAIPAELRAEFWHQGKYIKCDPNQINLGSQPAKVSLQNFAFVGGPISIDAEKVQIAEGGHVISWANERERLWKAKEVWMTLRQERATSVTDPSVKE